uniref:uncharacterized protein LOC109954486 n=1 Tax=Monopterus albus TaxID=43700 RepID=UPI0009B3C143|nr:zinc finger protein 496 [Monopterus albus]
MSDLYSILQTLMGEQEAREAQRREESARQEQRFKALQHQFQLLQLEVQARTTPVPDSPPMEGEPVDVEPPDLSGGLQVRVASPLEKVASSQLSAGQSQFHHMPRLEKLSDNDDIEHFWTTFEQIVAACRRSEGDWVFHLIPLLTGKARGAYVHMDLDDAQDYEKVKSAILTKYDINPETYRQKFRSLEVNPDESPKELYVRLKELYGKWIQPNGKTIQQIGETVILEQYLRMMSPELQVWIKEHNPESAAEAATLAEVFVAAPKKNQPWSYTAWQATRVPLKSKPTVPQPHQRISTSGEKFPMRERLEKMSEAQQYQKIWYDRSA